MQTFPNDIIFLVCHLKIVFNFLHELKQRSSDITGRPVISDVTEGVITTWINQIKFRLLSFSYFQNNWNFDLECKPNKHKTAFHARKVIGTSIEKRAPGHVWPTVQKTMALGSPVGPILRLFNHSGTDTIQ